MNQVQRFPGTLRRSFPRTKSPGLPPLLHAGDFTVLIYVDSDWYVSQPFLVPLDLSLPDEEIIRATRSMCQASAGFEPYDQWRERIAARMARFIPASNES